VHGLQALDAALEGVGGSVRRRDQFAQYVSPPEGGISIAYRIAAIGGRST
jgi:hypothetical protein